MPPREHSREQPPRLGLCCAREVLPFQGSSHDGGAPWENLAGSRGCPQPSFAAGRAWHRDRRWAERRSLPSLEQLSAVTSFTASAQVEGTHIPLHTRGAAVSGLLNPSPAGETRPSCQRGQQAPGAAGCGPAGQRAVMEDMCVGFGERLRWETGPCRDRGAVSCPKAQVPHEARHANAIQTTAGFEPNLPASGLICCNFD